MKTSKMQPEDYLVEPYARIVIPDKDSGTFTAMIFEFPGCIAQGNSPEDAYSKLEDVAKSWIEESLSQQQEIPLPAEATSYSGRILVRLPKSLHKRAAVVADKEGVSLNQFIVSTIAESVGAINYAHRLNARVDQQIFHICANYYSILSSVSTDVTIPTSDNSFPLLFGLDMTLPIQQIANSAYKEDKYAGN